MKIVVIGGVAAGTKTAAKLMRQDRSQEVVVYTKGKDISYAGCGLPYYVGGMIESPEELIVNTPAKYTGLTGVRVVTGMEAVGLDAEKKTVLFANGEEVSYDKLVIATGAYPFVPDLPGTGLEGVFTVRTPEDAIGIRAYVDSKKCHSAVIVGGGFIGLEIAENLLAKGLKVAVVDMASQLLPNLFDFEVSDYIRRHLQAKGVRVVTGTALKGIYGKEGGLKVSTSALDLDADLAVLAIGIRPATEWLAGSGIELVKGAVATDSFQRTNLEDVYAVGDCAQVFNRQTGKAQWSAMGSTANITGRLLAKNITGEPSRYGGCLGTGVVRLSDSLNAGRTGLTEEQAANEGYDAVSATCVTDDKAHYYADSSFFITKLVADRATKKLLGIQVLGSGAVDKMVDIAVTGIAMGASLSDFDTLDFAYAPPFSTAIHPFVQACYILENKLSGVYNSMTPAEYLKGAAKGYRVIDVNPAPTIPGALWLDLAKVTGPVEGLGKEDKLLLVCARGKRGYFLQNRLKAYGYTNTLALEGGLTVNSVKVELSGTELPPEEKKESRVLDA